MGKKKPIARDPGDVSSTTLRDWHGVHIRMKTIEVFNRLGQKTGTRRVWDPGANHPTMIKERAFWKEVDEAQAKGLAAARELQQRLDFEYYSRKLIGD